MQELKIRTFHVVTCLFFCLAGSKSSRARGPEGPGWTSAGLRSGLFDTSEC